MNAPDLHCHSTYSTLDGAGHPDAVVKRAKELGWTSAALTEHGHLMSATLFYQACRAEKINPILGIELYVVPDDFLGVNTKDTRSASCHLTTLALSKEGYQNLVAWTTFANKRENFYFKPRISPSMMAEVAPYPLHHNVVFSGCLSSELLKFIRSSNGNMWSGSIAYIDGMKSLFPNFYIELQNHYIDKYVGQGFTRYDELLEIESQVQPILYQLAKKTNTPLVITNDSHMQSVKQRKAHLAMKRATWEKYGEGHMDASATIQISKQLEDYSYFGNYMRSMESVADGVEGGEEAIDNVIAITKEADIKLDFLDEFKYSIPFSGYKDPVKAIYIKCQKRLAELREKHGRIAGKRFEHELSAMGDFAHYLLLMAKFINYAKEQGILTNSRGSAANSILCYCLGIHDVDSIEYGLTFERFYNPSRKKLPDIDIDIEPDRHDDFMRYVKETMTELEGEGQVVQICNYGTLANRSAFRMMADALGVDKDVQDQISKLLPQMIDSGMVDEGDNPFEIIKDEYPDIYELTAGVFDAIKSVSQHACGWLLGTESRPIANWIPLCLIASSGASVTQFNLKALESWGLVKGDFLRLKTLSVIKRTLTSLGMNALDLGAIPLDDPETYQMLREGKTQGVHSMQGKTQRRGCIEVGVDNIDDVIAVQALYRPSGTRTGFDKIFCNRKHRKDDVDSFHSIVDKILEPTYGLPIYQEQTLDIGYAIGMNDDEVQQLLDAIKKAKGVGRGAAEAFDKIKPAFMNYALKYMNEDEAEAIWKLQDAFQGYGFNKGHATSYAILAVKAAYLKRHHPKEFYASLLDVYPERSEYIAAARADGFKFLSPDINYSQAGFSAGKGDKEIRVGLSRIEGLGPASIREIIKGQPYGSLEDFKQRTSATIINKARFKNLVDVGAFESLGIKPEVESKDLTQFNLLKFTLDKPQAFKAIKPKHVGKRKSGKWEHKGLYNGADITEGLASISKLFWIPPLPKNKVYSKKATAWAKAKFNLLTVIDKNGIPFDIISSEEKVERSKLLNFIASKCRGSIICLDGAIRLPFLKDGYLNFALYSVAGAYADDAQLWSNSEAVDDYKKVIVKLTRDSSRK